MNKKIVGYIVSVIFVSIAISSCKVTKPYQLPAVNTSTLYRDVAATDTSSIANLRYTQIFTDTVLQRLIADGIARNLDLQMAYTRIQQAQAYYLQSRAAFLPSADANGSIGRSKFSAGQGFGARPPITQYQLGVSSSWEADIWGKLSSSKRANIANFYFALLALDQQLSITQQTIINWDTTVQTMRALKEAARVTEAAVVQTEAQRYAAEVTIPDLKQSIKETENALSILVGLSPGSINRSRLENQSSIAVLQTGVPVQLLANRPDVLQAELNFRYFFELTNVARTNFYPSLTITGSAGLSSLSFGQLFNPTSLAASIAAGLTQPVFNRRLNKTRLEVAKAQQQEAILNFQNTLLNAGREVSDALSLHETALEKIAIRTNQMTALQKSVDYTQELIRNGFGNYVEIITARQSLLQAELGGVNDRLQQLQATVNLYRSLGGGWR